MYETGVNFPAHESTRGSTETGKYVIAESVRDLDPLLARRIEVEADWRQSYPRHLEDVTRVEAQSAAAALQVARRGLEAAHQQFVFVGPEGDHELAAASHPSDRPFETAEVVGTGDPVAELTVPYRGQTLRGSALLRQLDDWVSRGITEPSFADAVGDVVRNPSWLDLSDQTFALLGAGAAMGPYNLLIQWGARVAAVDIPRPQIWERLVETARSSAGHLLMPVRTGAEDSAAATGADLLTELGDVQAWLRQIEGPMTIGNYGYIPGAGFVRLSMAFDALFAGLSDERSDVSLAYLATPSDVFMVPTDAVDMAQRRYRRLTPANLAARGVRLASGGRFFKPNYNGTIETSAGRYGLVNAFILEQGQNYALAKRLQRWRMVVARDDGIRTSVHVAPPTKTASVLQNPTMGQRQRLTAKLGHEAFESATSQALGAAVLVHDLRNPKSPANPEVPLDHPHEAFMFAANPGGRWRVPHDPSSSVPALAFLERLTPSQLVRNGVAAVKRNRREDN